MDCGKVLEDVVEVDLGEAMFGDVDEDEAACCLHFWPGPARIASVVVAGRPSAHCHS